MRTKKKISKGVRKAREKDPTIIQKISNSKKKFFEDYKNRESLSIISKQIIEEKYDKWLVSQEKAKKAWENAKNKGGFSKFHETPLGKVQGKFELKYINSLIKANHILPNKVRKSVKTSLGNYLPDFEFEDKYIEIKSTYTWRICQGLELNLKKKYCNKQYLKIIETGKKIKPVEVLVFDNKFLLVEKILF